MYVLTGPEATALLRELGISHVVWVPDSLMGTWQTDLDKDGPRLVRVCREGEAWAVAAGLHLGGCRPLVVIQSTGFYESGDAMRNVLYDLHLPLYAWIGYRSYLLKESADSARRFAEPLLRAWGLDYVLIDQKNQADRIAEHYRRCQDDQRAGVALLAEGKG